MLNKKVCRQCIKRQVGKQVFERSPLASFVGWDDSDEKRWHKRYVLCCRERNGYDRASVKEDPPEWCSFGLEHIVSKKV